MCRLRKFLHEHSLSIALLTGWLLLSAAGWWAAGPENNFWYDFWLMNAGGFGGSAILVVLAKHLWERGSDPAEEPKQ